MLTYELSEPPKSGGSLKGQPVEESCVEGCLRADMRWSRKRLEEQSLALSQFNLGSSLFPPPRNFAGKFYGGGQNLPVKFRGGRNNEEPEFTGLELESVAASERDLCSSAPPRF
jgi:hypothetical protein